MHFSPQWTPTEGRQPYQQWVYYSRGQRVQHFSQAFCKITCHSSPSPRLAVFKEAPSNFTSLSISWQPATFCQKIHNGLTRLEIGFDDLLMNKLQWSYYSLHDKLYRAHDCAVDLKTASQKQSKLASENGFLIFTGHTLSLRMLIKSHWQISESKSVFALIWKFKELKEGVFINFCPTYLRFNYIIFNYISGQKLQQGMEKTQKE